MSNRKRVYVAGPITSSPLSNMNKAIDAGQELIYAGFAPMVPHLTVYWNALNSPDVNSWETWLEIDLPWVKVAEAVLRLPGNSPGADREVSLALALGIPVFNDIQHLILWFASSEAKETRKVTREDIMASVDAVVKRQLEEFKKAKEPEISISAKSEFQGGLPTSVGKVLANITATFTKKNADYAADADGWRSNFDDIARQCSISATEAANTLIAVKQARLRALSSNGRAPANEAIEDTLLDRAVYAVLALALYQEDNT